MQSMRSQKHGTYDNETHRRSGAKIFSWTQYIQEPQTILFHQRVAVPFALQELPGDAKTPIVPGRL